MATGVLAEPKPRRSRKRRRTKKTATITQRVDTREIHEWFSPVFLKRDNIDRVVLFWMVGIHVGCLAAPFYFTWRAFWLALVVHWLTASVGVCLGFHRYLSHKSLRLAKPAEFFVLLCSVASGQGSPLMWTATHRLHHQRSDQEGDPHSPLEGKWWSHLLWLFVNHSPEQRAVIYQRYVPDLVQRPMLQFFEKTYGWWLVVVALLCFAIAGVPGVLWAVCVRMALGYHSTWFVNSATHLWGYRNYVTRDESRNLWWVALMAFGEGWHNNHHAHPHAARAGHRWWEIDMTWWVIRALQVVGLATDVDDRNPLHDSSATVEAAT